MLKYKEVKIKSSEARGPPVENPLPLFVESIIKY